MQSFGFPPLASSNARVLVLGSLPGRRSIEASEYYANPQNGFWKIARAHDPSLPEKYGERAAWLGTRGVALWDVLAAATRSGSLDADIEADAVPNNFRAFFHAYPDVRVICFNGATAAKLYRRLVMPTLSGNHRELIQHILPSTSGAHASLSFTAKVERWSPAWRVLQSLRDTPK
jgi:double-stranded uracil-DNA glycosylase